MDPVTQTLDGIPLPDAPPPKPVAGAPTGVDSNDAPQGLPGIEVTEELEGETMVGDAGASYVPAEADLEASDEPPVP